jgi:hypothetical protein
MSSRPNRFRKRVLAALIAAALPVGSFALADVVDPTMPRTISVGAPRGASPSDRGDSARTGRVKVSLPYPPVEAWRKHVSGGLEQAPIADDSGNLILALTSAEVVKLSPEGKEIWRTRVGTSPPVAPPLFTSDGTIIVLTSSGSLYGLRPSGAIKFTTSLGTRGRDDTTPLATRDGGIVAAVGHSLIEVDADGAVRSRATIEERPTGGLIAGPEGTLITTESGTVFSWRSPLAPKKLGTFSGVPRRGAAFLPSATGGFVVAVIDNRRVVALELATGTTHVRSSAAPSGSFFDGPVAIAQGGLVLAAAQSGTLYGFDSAGNDKLHSLLEKQALVVADAGPPSPSGPGIFGIAASAFLAQPELKPSPPVIVDDRGRVGFVRSGGRVGVATVEGAVSIASEKLCNAPIAVTAAGEKRMLASCRDGSLWMYGE